MELNLKQCTLKIGDVFFSMQKANEKEAVLKRNAETKTLSVEVLKDLAFFFRPIEADDVQEPGDAKIELFSDEKTVVIEGDGTESVFTDLLRFFNAYWEGTAKPWLRSLHSFDGGGPEYRAETEIKNVVTWSYTRVYSNPDHERLCGSGFNYEFVFSPLRPGDATVTLKGYSPICPTPKTRLYFHVTDALAVEFVKEEFLEDPGRFGISVPQN